MSGRVPYANSQLGVEIENIDVDASGFSAAEILSVLTLLNAGVPGVSFVAERSVAGAYSTIHIGATTAFDQLGKVKTIAETTGREAGREAGDSAFVLLQNITSERELIQGIAHETGHLTGSLTHDYGKDGLTIDDFMISDTAIVTADGTATSVTIGTTTYAGDASASFEAATTAGYNAIVMQKVDPARFEVSTGKNVIADQIRMTGNTESDGGVISNSGTATLSGSTFRNNGAGRDGGAITNDGTMTVIGSTFTDNKVTGGRNGGAIYNRHNNGNASILTTLSGSTFSGGGAICIARTATIIDSIFSNNTADNANGVGGAIFNANTSTSSGGAVVVGDLTITGSTFSGNIAGAKGGAIYSINTASISGSTFSGNRVTNADGKGGAIYNTSILTIENSVFATASDSIYNDGGSLTLKGTVTLAGNLSSSNDITAKDATILMDISSYEGYNFDAIINNMAQIQEAAGYGITVSAKQIAGEYLLASGAGAFTGSITISDGTRNGLVTYNAETYKEVTFGDCIYTLTNRGDELLLDMIESIDNPWYTTGGSVPAKLEGSRR